MNYPDNVVEVIDPVQESEWKRRGRKQCETQKHKQLFSVSVGYVAGVGSKKKGAQSRNTHHESHNLLGPSQLRNSNGQKEKRMKVKKVKAPEKGYEHKTPVKKGRWIFLRIAHL